MKYVEVVADAGSAATLAALAQKVKAVDFRLGIVGDDGMQVTRLVVDEDYLQSTLDTLQNVLGAQPTARILVLDVEASLPKTEEEKHDEESATTVREMLYEDVERNARLDNNYVVLVILSAVVAAIGLIEDNVAVVIGAMVIAPLLGPNLALSLGTALGEFVLIRKAVKTLAAGVLLAVFLSVVIGLLYPDKLVSDELLARTFAEVDSIALALASGAAAALSLTMGLSSVLVGVMVAVALLPPAATLGLMLGQGNYGLAAGASLLLAANVASVNLASILVFFIKGIRPRTFTDKERASRGTLVFIIGWLVLLAILVFVILVYKPLQP